MFMVMRTADAHKYDLKYGDYGRTAYVRIGYSDNVADSAVQVLSDIQRDTQAGVQYTYVSTPHGSNEKREYSHPLDVTRVHIYKPKRSRYYSDRWDEVCYEFYIRYEFIKSSKVGTRAYRADGTSVSNEEWGKIMDERNAQAQQARELTEQRQQNAREEYVQSVRNHISERICAMDRDECVGVLQGLVHNTTLSELVLMAICDRMDVPHNLLKPANVYEV